jgi:hypothetical protein
VAFDASNGARLWSYSDFRYLDYLSEGPTVWSTRLPAIIPHDKVRRPGGGGAASSTQNPRVPLFEDPGETNTRLTYGGRQTSIHTGTSSPPPLSTIWSCYEQTLAPRLTLWTCLLASRWTKRVHFLRTSSKVTNIHTRSSCVWLEAFWISRFKFVIAVYYAYPYLSLRWTSPAFDLPSIVNICISGSVLHEGVCSGGQRSRQHGHRLRLHCGHGLPPLHCSRALLQLPVDGLFGGVG